MLAADFEDTATGGNHPVIGVTPIYDNTWYHAAAAYDGVNFKIYLNDVQDGSVATTATPRSDSIQHAAIGTALGSGGLIPSGQTQGFFQGQMDEVRIWNVGRTGADIISTMGIAVAPPAAGLIGRWALDDGSGVSATDSAGANPGTLQPAAAPPSWVTGSPFAFTAPAAGNYGMKLTGTLAAGDYVTFGKALNLGASKFTLEAWIKRQATGATTTTGTGGVTAIPIISKGMAEADGSNVDMNYFLGINATNALTADFEDTATGLNHPVTAATTGPTAAVIANDNTWHHVAATYDGGTWRLYMDGALKTTLAVGAFTPRFDSIQHAAIGTALNSTGGVGANQQGFFGGVVDEVRIWNYARSDAQT